MFFLEKDTIRCSTRLCINDLPDELHSICKIFADDTSLFSKVLHRNRSQDELNHDPLSISQWAFQWKMQFNPDPNKQATKVLFKQKLNKGDHFQVMFNNNQISQCSTQKHLGLILDS